MNHDFSKRKIYRLVVATAWQCIGARRKELAKQEYSKQRVRERTEAKKSKSAPPPPPPVLLCQSKLRSLDVVYRLALAEAGVSSKDPTPRTAARTAHLRKHGIAPKKKPARRKPKIFDSPVQELRLTTTQAGLAASCGCSVRSLQRHLDDFEAAALLKFRQKLPQGKVPTPSYQLVLDASFLDWQEVAVFANGTTVADGADRPPVLATAAGTAAPGRAPAPPGAPPHPPKNGLITPPGKV